MAVVEQVDHYQVDQEEVFQEALEEVESAFPGRPIADPGRDVAR